MLVLASDSVNSSSQGVMESELCGHMTRFPIRTHVASTVRFYSTPGVVLRPYTQALPGGLLEMQTLEPISGSLY